METNSSQFEGVIIMKRQFSHTSDLPIVYAIDRELKTVQISTPYIDSSAILRFCTNFLLNHLSTNVINDESGVKRIQAEYSLIIKSGSMEFNASVIKFMPIGSENEITLLINNVN